MAGSSPLRLANGSRVAVIGGGPAGSFFSYFLLQMASRVGLQLEVDIYEPRDFTKPGPKGCNMCGGIVSESLMQNLAAEGIEIPSEVVQRRLDSYTLHMDVGSVRIPTPLYEMRIAAVVRGAGPRTLVEPQRGFDGFVFGMAASLGARHVPEKVTGVDRADGRPLVRTQAGTEQAYDLLVGASGVNSPLLDSFHPLGAYRPPLRTKAYVSEFLMGKSLISRYLGNSMHVFLPNLPRLDFAALIPKSSWVTLCLLGHDIKKETVDAFVASQEVKQCMPPHWRIPDDFCHCSPKMNVHTAARPFGDRVVFVGDCGTTRLFKDGIGAAYRTAKAAARTAIFQGVREEDFHHGFWPTCRSIHADNRLGKAVFFVTRQIQKRRFARRGMWRMTSQEQKLRGDKRRMSGILWDTFTGSAPYGSVLKRSIHPGFVGRFAMEIAAGIRHGDAIRPKESVPMATGGTGLMGKKYEPDEVVYHQGDRGDCMYVIQGGSVEVIRREGDREFCIAVLEKGEFFGEMALFDEEIRRFTVRALEPAYIFTLERNTLLARIHQDPSMAFRLLEKMARRIKSLEDTLIRQAPAVPV